MTTREELDRLADDIALWRRGHAQGSEMLGYILHPSEQLPVIAALRLASRQEASATVEEIEKFIKDKAYTTFDDWEDDFARALLAEYSITKRELTNVNVA